MKTFKDFAKINEEAPVSAAPVAPVKTASRALTREAEEKISDMSLGGATVEQVVASMIKNETGFSFDPPLTKEEAGETIKQWVLANFK